MKPLNSNHRLATKHADILSFQRNIVTNSTTRHITEINPMHTQSGNQQPFKTSAMFDHESDRPVSIGMLSGLSIGICTGAIISVLYVIDAPFFIPVIHTLIISPVSAALLGALGGAIIGSLTGTLLGLAISSSKVRRFEARLATENMPTLHTNNSDETAKEIVQWKRSKGEYRKI